MADNLRNIAIIAHVDHGKTTLVDQLLKQTGTLKETPDGGLALDSNDLEKERGITILSKIASLNYKDHQINLVDTPGHADFGGEVERILSMVDTCLLIVDAAEGPMPQTRFVTRKAFEHGLKPVVVINKIDRDGARPDWVIDQVFELFDHLGASDEQLDFPVLYASAIQGIASDNLEDTATDIFPILDHIINHTPAPKVNPDQAFQMQISSLDHSSYTGTIGIGRVTRGRITPNSPIKVIDRSGDIRGGRILQILSHHGLTRVETNQAVAGDIIAITGAGDLDISDTLCDPECIEALPALNVDEPTISMTFEVNGSPFSGQDGEFLTSRQIRKRLTDETQHNVALKVAESDSSEKFLVSGRGELHLSILIENMRREGFELAISRPKVILKEIDGVMHEPYELVTLDVQQQHQGAIIEKLNAKRGILRDMIPDAHGRVRLDYEMPSQGLFGFQNEMMSLTQGTGIAHHVFLDYRPYVKISEHSRHHGALIANAAGPATTYALYNLQGRGRMLIKPGDQVYEGMVIGLHNRDNDLVVNICRNKQLSNVRASGTDESMILTPPIKFTLEQAMGMINTDELVEITPKNIRIRKKFLKESDRKRESRSNS
ncbi:translational GTPase TypA [Candidatus Comchoanobacter bicostacola]|uniref:Large ribosomal subunit assembly factor BipA n=1 Tax=Candidatus Comchoanobacter bicostacola TaxID=2919598 RepID=A0ABY5DL22_9GAMM|nr:translational GTPase TypA [Candidatus Comchoanobacter bicostacola]UTC24830.1 translational GTPase TypA [Candidatus Comchoanobacter bicostacola]